MDLQPLVVALERAAELLGRSEASDWSAHSPTGVQQSLSTVARSIRLGEDWSPLDVAVEFAPTGPVQEIAVRNGWHDEYLMLAGVVDQHTRSVKWIVVRQDTHGTRFDIEGFDNRAEAEAMVKHFESGYPHHQTYFIEKRPSGSTEGC